MQIRLAASTTVVAFVLAACGSTSDDFDDASHSHGGASSNATGGASNGASAGASDSGRAGTGTSGRNATSGGAPGLGGRAAGASGGSSAQSGGRAGRSGMDAGAGGMSVGAGGMGAGGAGRANGAGGACAGDTCSGGAPGRGGRAGRSMGGGGASSGAAGNTSTAGAGGMLGAAGGGACPASGHVSYTLTKASSPSSDQTQAYGLITTAMDKAVQYYNCYTNITKADTVTYDPSVPTADGNFNGSIRFGGRDYMEYITAMHEIAHTVGVGTAPKWASLVVDGIFTGTHATAELRTITGNATDELNADTQHFWPYGLNYTSEVKSEADVIDHCLIVSAIRLDLGYDP